MTSWKDFFVNLSVGAEAQFDQLKNRLFKRLDAEKPYRIIYYRGFGSPTAVWLKGRVLREPNPSHTIDDGT